MSFIAPDLLGIDVGFSQLQKSTGIACLCDERLTLYRANSTWEQRKAQLPENFCPSMIAIDGPLLPEGADPLTVRACEQLFSKGAFCRRCKPGLSHFGTGLQLRQAAMETSRQFCQHFGDPGRKLRSGVAEAFPNLFLGVLASEEDYAAIPKLRRGQKFDWLYGCTVKKLDGLMQHIILPDVVYDRLKIETDHELRAALICLLTAALACGDRVVLAGSEEGGWFWLPPMEMWEPWAVEAVRVNLG